VSYKISGGNKTERHIAERCLCWCVEKFPLKGVNIYLRFAPITSAHGWATKTDRYNYEVTISTQYVFLSLMTETIIHELVHIKQWKTGEWVGDGEDEADEKAREISNLLWKANLI